MAARRLKFKPKPSVANSVRRGRDKEDFPGLTQADKSVSDKELSPTRQEALSSECKKENLNLSAGTDDNEILSSKQFETKHIVEVSSNVDGSGTATTFPAPLITELCKVQNSQNCSLLENNTTLNGVPHEQDRTASNSVPSINSSIDKGSSLCTSQNIDLCSLPSKYVLNQKIESICNSSDINCEKASFNTDQGSPCCAPDRDNCTILSTNSSTKDSLCDKSTSKSNSAKVFSRFGRSRCKPVLNNSNLRKKNEVSEDIDNSISVCNLRTDSVIKSVKSELSKINSLAKENDNNCNKFELDKPLNSSLNEKHVIPSKSRVGRDEITVVEKNQSIIHAVVNDFIQTTTISRPTDLNDVNENKKLMEKPCFIDINCKNDKILSTNEKDAEVINTITKPSIPSKVLVSPLRPNSKVLVPKPCPRLTDAASRRVSFHGSDSEDEAKKKCSNLKEKSNTPQIDKKETNLKNSKRKRSQGPTFSKLGQDTMKELTKKLNNSGGGPDKTKLTMLDLIFYNPTNNPMSVNPNQTPAVRKKEDKIEVSEVIEESLEEQSVDDVESNAGVMPVPQLKVGPDGQIMLDPHSLVIETTGMQKSREKLENSQVVQENGLTRYNTYSKRKPKRCDWTPKETLQFYRALSTIGSDFSLMTHLFPNRTRRDLKLKFKREERTNMQLVDKAMKMRSGFDVETLKEEFKQENEEIERKQKAAAIAKEAAKQHRALRKTEMNQTIGAARVTDRSIRLKYSAFKEFSIDEVEQLYKEKPNLIPRAKRKATRKRRKVVGSDSEEELALLESDSSDVDISLKTDIKFSCRRSKRRSKTLKECEEINETLKKKLEHENVSKMEMEEKLVKTSDCEPESEDDVYTPNGPNAFMLFGSPKNCPSEEPEEEPSQVDLEDPDWNIEIQRLPIIEETVMLDNVDEVSELSELGSFGQNDAALDLSVPVRANITSDMLKDRHSLLNRHLISESIQIIDQLTSVESSCSSVLTDIKKTPEHDLEDSLSVEELADSQIRLPSFESVNRSRPSMAYPLQVPYDPRNYERNIPEVGNESDNQKSHENSSLSNVFIANFYRETTEECILGD